MATEILNKLDLLSDASSAYFLENNLEVEKYFGSPEVEVLPIEIIKYNQPELFDKFAWRLVSPNQNSITRLVASVPNQGYYIHVRQGAKVNQPIKTCLMTSDNDVSQVVHNIIVLEPSANCEIITGCVSTACRSITHTAVTEIFVGKNAKLKLKMIHDWADSAVVMPVTKVVLAENAEFDYEFVCLKSPTKLVSNPEVMMNGKSAKLTSSSSVVASTGSKLDAGFKVKMLNSGQSAKIISKNVARGGEIINRGEIVAKGDDCYGHIECDGVILDGGILTSSPIIVNKSVSSKLSHEASIGKIDQLAIEYLMSRGVSENQAKDLIIFGFLSPKL